MRDVTLEPKAYRTRVWCDGVYVGSLFRNCVDGKLGGYWATWQEGEQRIERRLFSSRKDAVAYLTVSAEVKGRLS
jgi:hypothetical protein